MPRVPESEWAHELEDDEELRAEVDAEDPMYQGDQDFLDPPVDDDDEDWLGPDDFCPHGLETGSGLCGYLCTDCGHPCDDHEHFSDARCLTRGRGTSHDPELCPCAGYTDETNLDVMARSLDELKKSA